MSLRRVFLLVLAACALCGAVMLPASAALQGTPAWYQASAAASSAWHYRVPLTLPANTSAGATAVFDVDFAALLAQLAVSGTLDVNSPRVTLADGTTLVAQQEFSDSIYNRTTDALNNGRGELRFITTGAATTYYVYFDIAANGTKGVNSATPIGGNFENAAVGSNTIAPPGWALTRSAAAIDSQVRPSETVSVTSDGTLAGAPLATQTVDGTPRTGNYSYLLGARSANEAAGSNTNTVVLSRSISVPATNPGVLNFHFRTQGWDSNDNGNTANYDYLRALIIDGATNNEIVGPLANNYVTAPFSPNKATVEATATNSGYGQYNGFDTDITGVHHAGMTVARGAEPWWDVTVPLAQYAGRTVTLQFATNHTNLYRSWWHIDDVEWSVVAGTLGAAQAFGAALELPLATASFYPGDVLSLRARLDAVGKTGAVVADLYRPNGTLALGGITLYNDATHGDTTAADALWTNTGLVLANPTWTFAQADLAGTWSVILRAADGSAATGGQSTGLVHVPGKPFTPINGTNFFNVDTQTFTFTPFMTISGKVYVDSNRSSTLDTGEPVAAGMFVKLVKGGVWQATATPDVTGSYSFPGLRTGTYTVIQSINNLSTDLTPSVPGGFVQSEPVGVSHIVDLAGGVSVTRNFGQYQADGLVTGSIFVDSGAGFGTALDGVQNGTEAPIALALITLKDALGTVVAQTRSRGDGQFSIAVPPAAAGTQLTLSTPLETGFNLARLGVGTTAGTASLAAGTIVFTPAAKTNYSGVVFSELPVSTLAASQAQAMAPGQVASYAHRFTVAANGTVVFSLSSQPPAALSQWQGVLYQDTSCSGVLNGTEVPLSSTTFTAKAGDYVCFVVRDLVPASAAIGMRNLHTLSATLTVTQGAGYTQATVSNLDVTTVGTAQGTGLTLLKSVRNVTASGTFGTNNQALPGETLQYRVAYRNDTASPISGVQVFDSVPAYAVFGSALCETSPPGVTCAVAKAPANGATSGDLQWNLTGSLAAGAQGSVTFTWSVAP